MQIFRHRLATQKVHIITAVFV